MLKQTVAQVVELLKSVDATKLPENEQRLIREAVSALDRLDADAAALERRVTDAGPTGGRNSTLRASGDLAATVIPKAQP